VSTDDDVVNDETLQPTNRAQGHSGTHNRRRRTAVKALTAGERLDHHCAVTRATDPHAHAPETDEQYAARKLAEEERRIERRGRPRKGAENAKVYPVRLEPSLHRKIKVTTGQSLREFIETAAASLVGEVLSTQ